MYKKLISALLVLCLVCSPMLVPSFSADKEKATQAETKGDKKTKSYKSKISDLRSKEKEYQERLKKTKADIHAKEQYSSALVSQINVLTDEITQSHIQVDKLKRSISKKQRAIKNSKNQIETQMKTLKKRIRSIYMAGDTSSLEIILGAKDFGDFIDKLELIKSLSAYDQKLINSLKGKLQIISKEKKSLVSAKKKAEASQKILTEKQDKLTKLLKDNEDILSKLYNDQNDAKKLLNNANSQESEIQGQLSAYYSKLDEKEKAERAKRIAAAKAAEKQSTFVRGGTGSGSGSSESIHVRRSGFTWPVPGYYYVISKFAEDRGYSHKGIDITGSGIMGANVVAAFDGTVIACNDDCIHNWGKSGSCGCGGGYGNYVLIEHSNGKQTLYGHLSATTVSLNQKVTKGMTIGYVGSTGWSTGAHLHFECRYDGVPYNPMQEY